jgi:hypothetical protein
MAPVFVRIALKLSTGGIQHWRGLQADFLKKSFLKKQKKLS